MTMVSLTIYLEYTFPRGLSIYPGRCEQKFKIISGAGRTTMNLSLKYEGREYIMILSTDYGQNTKGEE
jgi:hypothetical protein